MKKTIIAILCLLSLQSFGQTDTTKLTSKNLTLRVNDWEYATTFIAYQETFENTFDSIKLKLRTGTYPTGTTQITVGAVQNSELIALSRLLRTNYNPATASTIDRIHTAIRAMNTDPYHWVNRQLTAMDEAEQTTLTNRRQEGKRRLRRQ